MKFTLKSLLPRELFLTALDPVRTGTGMRSIRLNRAVSGRPIAIAGERFAAGLGTRANSEIEYDLRGLFNTFSAAVGVDDGNNNDRATVEFVVLGDGKELWHSGPLEKI